MNFTYNLSRLSLSIFTKLYNYTKEHGNVPYFLGENRIFIKFKVDKNV